jgi:hypothetical protein
VIKRLGAWTLRMLIAIDQLIGCWLKGWCYVWIGGELPSADETLSAWVGRKAVEGKRWALIAEKIIDKIMLHPGHCRLAIENDDRD